MIGLALALYALFLVVVFGWRAWLQYRRTGDHGFRGFSGRVASAEWFAGALIVASLFALLAAPVAALTGIAPVPRLPAWIAASGIAVAVLGCVLTVAAQVDMGNSWRVGVDPSERTALRTDGLFAVVRNPVFCGMGLFALGFFLLVPGILSALGLVFGAVGIELQVRCVEEPLLLRIHGDGYSGYASRVGRFLPWLGRLPAGR